MIRNFIEKAFNIDFTTYENVNVDTEFYMNEHMEIFKKFEFDYEDELRNHYGFGLGETIEEAIENACIFYIKQNGFKLEWFDGNSFQIYQYYGGDTLKSLSITATRQAEETKLFAWLYANDIKVVE